MAGWSWRQPLPSLDENGQLRWVLRLVLLTGGQLVRGVENAEALRRQPDPVIVALNHTTKLEALLVPALLMALRGGRVIHFLADWNFLLVPGVAALFRVGQVIPVNRKPARPAFLNRLRPRLCPATPAHELARSRLGAGASVGIFPEGTATGSPNRLQRGLRGAAQLALETGVPLLPVGLRHATRPGARRVGNFTPFTLHVGEPLSPPAAATRPDREAVLLLHARLMRELAALSGKEWNRPAFPQTTCKPSSNSKSSA